LIGRQYTKEHVIGRRFVPKGLLNKEWNLILRACNACNHAKSDLEDDISAITLQPNVWGRHPTDHPIRDAEARRKAEKSKSRRTNKVVAQSVEHFDVQLPFGPGVGMTFGLVSPPQLDEDRVYRLCLMHSQAFFYWISYNAALRRGGFWPGSFFPLLVSVRSDWGNPIHQAFVDTVSQWEIRVQAIGANEHFKVAIRKHPSLVCWSWAYEWNVNVRILGFFGDEVVAQDLVNKLPPFEWRTIRTGNERYREEVPLSADDDKMFS